MQVAEIHGIDTDIQIGGGAGYVAGRVRAARDDVRVALRAINAQPVGTPSIDPHPREAAIAAAREAVIHLNEALDVEAPEDALMDTRHALEELVGTIAMLERMGSGLPVRPGDPPAGRFERAIGLLVTAEHALLSRSPRENDGIVPPWLRG
jgi:hypothetical protein